MKYIKVFVSIGLVLCICAATSLQAEEAKKENNVQQVPAPDTVTMLDLGATKCIPCKMMAPIIEELQKEYAGRASIIFIDVWENPDEARKYGIRSIPTQIFYDKDGKEAGRHVGFLDKKSIVKAFEDLGVPGETKQ
jgi:thioredoxin 1